MQLHGIGELGEHRLAADLELVVPHAHKHLRLKGVGEDVGIALHLGGAEPSKKVSQTNVHTKQREIRQVALG